MTPNPNPSPEAIYDAALCAEHLATGMHSPGFARRAALRAMSVLSPQMRTAPVSQASQTTGVDSNGDGDGDTQALPAPGEVEYIDRAKLKQATDDLIVAVRNSWGIGSAEHNLVRDICDLIDRAPGAALATVAAANDEGVAVEELERWTILRKDIESERTAAIPKWAEHLLIGGYREHGWTAFDQTNKGSILASGKWGDSLALLKNGSIRLLSQGGGKA